MTRIVPPDPKRAEDLYDLVAKVFSTGGYYEFLRFAREAYFPGSTYDWEASRVAEADGEIVSHVGVWAYRMRVGRARLRTGGIGAVATHAGFRNRRLASRLCRAVVKSMRQGGYDYSILFGRRNFYHRVGYVQAWPRVVHSADVEALDAPAPRLSIRKVPLAEAVCGRGAVMRIYDRDNATRTGSAERPIYTRTGGGWLSGDCWTLVDRAGKVRGYVVGGPRREEFAVREVGGLSRACGVGQLLAAIARLASRAGCRRVRVEQHAPDHPLCVALRRGDCQVYTEHHRSGGAMGIVVSLRGCLAAMTGEMTDRLRASPLKRFRGTLGVEGAGEKAALTIAGGRVRLADRTGRAANRIVAGREIARLIIGSEAPSVLAEQGDVSVHGRAAELAEALFPQRWPMDCALDHF